MNPRLLLKLIPISQNNWFTLNLTTKNQHHFTVNMQSSEFIFSGSRLVVQLGFFQSLEFTVRQDGCAVMIIFIPKGSSEEQLIHPKSILFQRRIDPPNLTTKKSVQQASLEVNRNNYREVERNNSREFESTGRAQTLEVETGRSGGRGERRTCDEGSFCRRGGRDP
jgi:hypothetical protein